MLLQRFLSEAQHRVFRVGSKAYINGITSDKVIVYMLYYSGIKKQATKAGSFWAIYRHLPLTYTVFGSL